MNTTKMSHKKEKKANISLTKPEPLVDLKTILKIDHLPIDDIPDDDIVNDFNNIQSFYDQFREKPDAGANKPVKPISNVTSKGNTAGRTRVKDAFEKKYADDNVNTVGPSSSNIAYTSTANGLVKNGTKSEVEQYMDFLRANKIIEKNKWDLIKPNSKIPSSVGQNVGSSKSKLNPKGGKLSDKPREPSVDQTVSSNTTRFKDSSSAKHKEGKTFKEMLEHLKKQIHSLADFTNQTAVPDIKINLQEDTPQPSLVSQKSTEKKQPNTQSRLYKGSGTKGLGRSSKRRKMQQRSKIDVATKALPGNVTRSGGVVKSKLLHPGKADIPAPDEDEEEFKLYDVDSPELTDNALANMAAGDVGLPSNRRDNETFHVIDQGKDSFEFGLESDSWMTKIHGHPEIIAAGSVVMGIGILFVLGYVIHALVVRRRNKRHKLYRRLDSERDRLLTNSDFSLFPETSSSDDSDSDDYNRNKSRGW